MAYIVLCICYMHTASITGGQCKVL